MSQTSSELNSKKALDLELVQASLENPDNYAQVISRWEQPLSRYIRRRANVTQQDLEDILQDVFIKMYVNLNDFDQSLQFSSWAYRITHNQVVSWFRKHEVRTRDLAPVDPADVMAFIKSETDGADDLFAKVEDVKVVQDAMGELSDKYRELIILKYFEHHDYQSMSDILQIPPGTVATRLNRARKKLRSLVESSNNYETAYE